MNGKSARTSACMTKERCHTYAGQLYLLLSYMFIATVVPMAATDESDTPVRTHELREPFLTV